MRFTSWVVVLAAAQAAAWAGPLSTTRPGAIGSANPLNLLSRMTLQGDFVAGATCIGLNGSGGPRGGTIAIAGIPAGATVTKAYLWYVVIAPQSPVPSGSPTVNGTPIPVVPLGERFQSPCFPQSYSAAFRADVSAIVSGNGSYTLDNFPALGTWQNLFTAGATIAVVYCRAPNDPIRDVVIYDGVDILDGGSPPMTQTLTGFTAAPFSGSVKARWLAVIGNGQDTTSSNGDADPLSFNGTLIESLYPTSQVLSGGACANSTFPPPDNGYWDLGVYDVSTLIPTGATSATMSLSSGDCYSVVAAAFSVTTDAIPDTCLCEASVDAVADLEVCEGQATVLDASGIATPCLGTTEFRWSEAGTPISGWSTSSSLPITPLATTTYTVEARCSTESGCVANDTLTVTVDAFPTAAAGPDAEVCAGGSTTIDASASTLPSCVAGLEYRWSVAGTPLAPWSPTASLPVTPAATTTYDLEVRCASAPACVSTDSVVVRVNEFPSAVAGADTAVCTGGTTTLDASASTLPGCATLEYRWSVAGTPLAPWSATATQPVTPAATTTYDLEVRCASAPSCVSTDSVVVAVNLYPTAAAGPDAAVCAGQMATLDASASSLPGCTALEYRWSSGGSPLGVWTANPVTNDTPVTTTTYTVEVRCATAPSCIASDTVVVTVNDLPTPLAGADKSICDGQATTLDGSASSLPGCGSLEYRWSTGGTPLGPWSTTPTQPVSPASTTTYTLEVRCATAPTCVASDATAVAVYPIPVASAGPDQTGCSDIDYTLSGSATSLPPCTALEYRWSVGGTPLGPWSSNPIANVNVAADTTYTLESRCAALPGCVSSDDTLVDVHICTTAVSYGSYEVVRVSEGARLRWSSIVEAGSLGFEVWVRDGAGHELKLPGFVYATGSGSSYEFPDTRAAARSGEKLWYRVVEQTPDGPGDATDWLALGEAGGSSGGGSRHRGGSRR